MPRCPECHHRFATLPDEEDMHPCPFCGFALWDDQPAAADRDELHCQNCGESETAQWYAAIVQDVFRRRDRSRNARAERTLGPLCTVCADEYGETVRLTPAEALTLMMEAR